MKFLQIRLKTLLMAMVPIAILAGFLEACFRARVEVRKTDCLRNLEVIAHSLRSYRETNGQFPRAGVTDQNGKPVHSWRIMIEQLAGWRKIFGEMVYCGFEYDLGQSWDSPGNLSISRSVPLWHVCMNNQEEPYRYTNYVALIDHGVSSLESADSLVRGSPEEARHVLIVEYPNSDILWTEPRDLDINDLSRLNEGADSGLGVIFGDGRFRRVSLAELRTLLAR